MSNGIHIDPTRERWEIRILIEGFLWKLVDVIYDKDKVSKGLALTRQRYPRCIPKIERVCPK